MVDRADDGGDAAAAYGLADTGRASWTWTWDWVDLSGLPSQSIHAWRMIRMCLNDSKDAAANDRLIELSDEDIGVLMGTVENPKHRTTVYRAVQPLYELGALEVVEERKTSVRVPNKAKPEVRTVRVLRVHEKPPQGWGNYDGPVNPFDKLRQYRHALQQQAAAGNDGSGSGVADTQHQNQSASKSKSNQKQSPAKTKKKAQVSPGQCDVADPHHSCAKTHKRGAKTQRKPTNAFNQSGKPTNQDETEPTSTSEAGTPDSNGWLEDDPQNTGKPKIDEDGARLLRALPHGIGVALAGHAVNKWSHVVGEALRGGMSENAVRDKLTGGLDGVPAASRVRIVAGRRLRDLAEHLNQAPQRAADRHQSETEWANDRVDRMAAAKEHGAREAAGLLGEVWNPEQYRGDAGAQEWFTEILPKVSRDFVEQRRPSLLMALTSNNT